MLTNSGMSPEQQGLVGTLVPVGSVVGSFVPARWLDKVRIKSLIAARTTAMAGSAIAVASTSDPWIVSTAFSVGWATAGAAGLRVNTYTRQ
ncbi:hypothetical protein, partial [Nocardia farcinica]